MKKSTKKQIEVIARKAWAYWAFGRARHVHSEAELRVLWKSARRPVRRHWMQVVQLVVAELMEKASCMAKPKSCRLVDGKVVCK